MQLITEIQDAYSRISGQILRTPLTFSPWLSEQVKGDVYLKLESEQYTGSFKARGSLNKLMWLKEQQNPRLPVTASTGNHGLGFARALQLLKMEGRIFLPKNASKAKVEAIKKYGGMIEFYGDNPYETEIHTRKLAEEKGWAYVSPYNDLQVIAGQGTIGVEIEKQLPEPDMMLVTVGGGGLLSGAGSWMKQCYPNLEVIGCQPEASPEMALSVRAGEYVEIESGETLSDGSAGGFERGAITFDLCKKLTDDFVLVSENEIKEGIRIMLQHHHKLVEGSAAVVVASLLKQPQRYQNKRTVIIICGANISYSVLRKIVCES